VNSEWTAEQQEESWWQVAYRCPRCSWSHEQERDQGPIVERDCPNCGWSVAVRPLDGRDIITIVKQEG
jgi:DNA-directed RNA polymerase subunit RPC12/RpoP